MGRKRENIKKQKDSRYQTRYINDKSDSMKEKNDYNYMRQHLKITPKSDIKSKNIEQIEDKELHTVREVCDVFLETKIKSIKASTYMIYEGIVSRYICTYFEDELISNISNENIQSFINSLSFLAPKTIQDIYTLFKTILKFAIKRKYMQEISFDVERPRREKPQIKVLTRCQQDKLQDYISSWFELSKIGILLGLSAGLRIGEVCALKLSDINIEEGTINIEKTLQRTKTLDTKKGMKTMIAITAPKSQCSIRQVPLPSYLFDLFSQIKQNYDDDSYVLTGSYHYIEPRSYSNRFKKCLNDCGIRDIHFHCLRHTFATRCIEFGVDIKTLSEILGHSSVKTTLDFYVHSSMEQKKTQIEKMNVLFNDDLRHII